ncbi:hypothetical protein CO709_08105 [Burkholderia thailandensis]|nr:hypothetical protein CO709_08105 [Burkholderia thailandensis]
MRSRCWLRRQPPPLSISTPLQGGICFLDHPLPASPSAFLAVRLPRGRGFGLIVFRTSYTNSLGPAFLPVTACPCVRSTHRATRHIPFGPSLSASWACQI